jgi:pimeloyl-ACP methyl ester carboxylesterase
MALAIGTVLSLLVVGFAIYIAVSGPKLPPETDEIIERVLNSELPEVIRGTTGFVSSDGLAIWYESILPKVPPKGVILLIMGIAGDALTWPPAFVRAFVEAGYQVMRYDHRGTGLSDWVDSWDRKKPYSLTAMADDAIAILNALTVQKVHLIGLSMGGMIAQEIAIHQPGRVTSLTLIMTSGYIGDRDLPGLTSRYFFGNLIKGIPLLKYRLMGGERNLIKERIAKTIQGVGYEELDIKEIAEVVLYDLRKRRGINLKAVLQHQAAVSISGSRYDQLKALNVPTLVIHGTADSFIPIEHGKKLVEVIPNAKGLWIAGVGHVFPLPNMHDVNNKIMAFFERPVDFCNDHQAS